MKYLNFFEDFNYQELHDTKTFTLYRGTDYNIALYRPLGDPLFLSNSESFAKDYGKNIFEIKISPKSIFDSSNPEHFKLLFKWLGKNPLEDRFYDDKYYSYEEMVEKYPSYESDTWELIEDHLDFIEGEGYDTVLITEGGVVNFMVLDDSIIKDVKQL